MKKKVALHTLGCKANQADSVYLEGTLRQKGYQIVGLNENADYYIFNTCTVTAEADREARQLTRRVKRQNPQAKVIVTGCYAQTQPETVASLSSVDHVISNAAKDKLPDLMEEDNVSTPETDILRQNNVSAYGLSRYSRNTRAFVKIQDGCSKFCTFCIIPYARGKNRSVPIDEIIRELRDLHQHGFEEAILTGIHIGTYGHERHQSLEDLLKRIAKERPIGRVRLSSLDPEEVSHGLVSCVTSNDIFCPHFHIAVQSGDDTILDRMKRRYHSQQFYQAVDFITSAMPDAAIGTDLIVGFPGETEEQFARTYRMIEELPISYVHVFPYSPRKGTPAADYRDQVSRDTKRQRMQELLSLAQQKKSTYQQRFIGQTLELVVEARRDIKEGTLRGVSPNYIPVYFEGDDNLFRQCVSVRLTHYRQHRCYGVIQ